ncbi:MAG TPA: hypothetical protein ENK86_00225 [Campylobacterales bacterium]|nr:hypothetical protein [Campylobacterales bacterium]
MKIPIQRIRYTLHKLQSFDLFKTIDLPTLEAMIPAFHYQKKNRPSKKIVKSLSSKIVKRYLNTPKKSPKAKEFVT